MRVYNGVVLDEKAGASAPHLSRYDKSYSGIINSYIDRFPWSQKATHEIIEEWSKYKDFLKVPNP